MFALWTFLVQEQGFVSFMGVLSHRVDGFVEVLALRLMVALIFSGLNVSSQFTISGTLCDLSTLGRLLAMSCRVDVVRGWKRSSQDLARRIMALLRLKSILRLSLALAEFILQLKSVGAKYAVMMIGLELTICEKLTCLSVR